VLVSRVWATLLDVVPAVLVLAIRNGKRHITLGLGPDAMTPLFRNSTSARTAIHVLNAPSSFEAARRPGA
jgi:hypothetical protein